MKINEGERFWMWSDDYQKVIRVVCLDSIEKAGSECPAIVEEEDTGKRMGVSVGWLAVTKKDAEDKRLVVWTDRLRTLTNQLLALSHEEVALKEKIREEVKQRSRRVF